MPWVGETEGGFGCAFQRPDTLSVDKYRPNVFWLGWEGDVRARNLGRDLNQLANSTFDRYYGVVQFHRERLSFCGMATRRGIWFVPWRQKLITLNQNT